jgi:hypothetical protein
MNVFPDFVKSILFEDASNVVKPGLDEGVRHWNRVSEMKCAGTTTKPNLHERPKAFLTPEPSTVTIVPPRVDGPTDGDIRFISSCS